MSSRSRLAWVAVAVFVVGCERGPRPVAVRPSVTQSFEELPVAAASVAAAPAPTTGHARRFEFIEGGSSKYWEISVVGSEVTVRFGRIGTEGQVRSKTFPDAAAAKRDADGLIREKLGKGYQEKSI